MQEVNVNDPKEYRELFVVVVVVVDTCVVTLAVVVLEVALEVLINEISTKPGPSFKPLYMEGLI